MTQRNTHRYLEPGAFVSGGFKTTCWQRGSDAVVFSGRGVISGEAFPWHSPLFEWALLNIDAGVGNVVDGITLIDSPMFHMASYSRNATIRNVKMLGTWPYNSDGFDTGLGGLVEDCFVRANDDSIKISGGTDSLVQRIVVWQMINGAVIQMGWISPLAWQRVTVRDIDVIHVDYCSASRGCARSNNEAIVDLAPGTFTRLVGVLLLPHIGELSCWRPWAIFDHRLHRHALPRFLIVDPDCWCHHHPSILLSTPTHASAQTARRCLDWPTSPSPTCGSRRTPFVSFTCKHPPTRRGRSRASSSSTSRHRQRVSQRETTTLAVSGPSPSPGSRSTTSSLAVAALRHKQTLG